MCAARRDPDSVVGVSAKVSAPGVLTGTRRRDDPNLVLSASRMHRSTPYTPVSTPEDLAPSGCWRRTYSKAGKALGWMTTSVTRWKLIFVASLAFNR